MPAHDDYDYTWRHVRAYAFFKGDGHGSTRRKHMEKMLEQADFCDGSLLVIYTVLDVLYEERDKVTSREIHRTFLAASEHIRQGESFLSAFKTPLKTRGVSVYG